MGKTQLLRAVIIWGFTLCLTIFGATSADAQSSDLDELVEKSRNAVPQLDMSDVMTNEQMLAEARARVEGIEAPDIDFEVLGDTLGYDMEAEIKSHEDPVKETLYIFVSFSMPDDLIKDYIQSAAQVDGLVVISGLLNNKFLDTVSKIEDFVYVEDGEAKGGVMIDPKAFETFGVTTVPTIVLAENMLEPCRTAECDREIPIHDRISGAVTLEYALTQFARDGDMKEAAEARRLKVSKDIYSVYRDAD